jgi:hypothetical protein
VQKNYEEITGVDSSYIKISDLHKYISRLNTPKSYIDKIQGIDYPVPEYMRYLQMEYFPTANWEIEDKPIFNMGKLVAHNVLGKLTWDYGYIGLPQITRTGMMVASHRVQYQRDNKERLVDLGNDTKASNTDTWKKALNFYLNICDDVYTWKTPQISTGQKEVLVNLLTQIEKIEKLDKELNDIKTLVLGDSLVINVKRYIAVKKKLRGKLDELQGEKS